MLGAQGGFVTSLDPALNPGRAMLQQGAGPVAQGAGLGCVREFTRHAGDVLRNLAELRRRRVLTDITLVLQGRPLPAHKAVLAACR